jgi:hypothetical protein
MKFYLTLLRHEGTRLLPDRMPQADRLVDVNILVFKGIRYLHASCGFRGDTVAELWEPVLSRMSQEDLTIRGLEHKSNAGYVQEWRLRPHHLDPWASKSRRT